MVGRKFKVFHILYESLIAKTTSGRAIPLGTIEIRCPVCHSNNVSTNGTQNRKTGRIITYICRNPSCSHTDQHTPKQFTLLSSDLFSQYQQTLQEDISTQMFAKGEKNKSVATMFHLDPAAISKLREEIVQELESLKPGLDLVPQPLAEHAISIDETFFKIQDVAIYLIRAIAWKSHKTIGLKVGKTRSEKDMNEVFQEAQRNCDRPISVVVSDAWGSTIAMLKNLHRNITHFIHIHKSPYDQVVIKEYTYSQTDRKTTTVGVKTDLYTSRKCREIHYSEAIEPLAAIPAKPKGRRKGSKNKPKGGSPKVPKKRGRKGLCAVFDTGKKGYVKIDPYRKEIKYGMQIPVGVRHALDQGMGLFARQFIQNNVSEAANSSFKARLTLKGPHEVNDMERKSRAMVIIQNEPNILKSVTHGHTFQRGTIMKNLSVENIANLLVNKSNIHETEKNTTGVIVH